MKFLQKKIDVFVNLLTRCARSPIYQALPFVFDKIFEAAGHVFLVVSPFVNRIKDQIMISLQILEFLPLPLVISAKKMQGV